MPFAPPPPPAAAPALLSQGLLGTDLQSWKASSPERAAAVCAPAPKAAGRLDCRLRPQPIGARYYARELTYSFVGGRLASVRFQSSIDAYAHVTALLKRAYGEPAHITRDTRKLANGYTLPHVAMDWRTTHGVARLSDPAAAGLLEVTLAAAPPQGAAPASRG